MSIFFIEDKNGNYFSADGKRRFIRLKGKAAYDYLKSPNGRGKRFYRLSAEEEKGIMILPFSHSPSVKSVAGNESGYERSL